MHSRLVAGAVLGASGTLLGLARWLNPSPTGMETHLQLGLKPCGFFKMTGLPCPSCGMTTAFAHAAHGHFLQSFMAQPCGAFLAFGTAVAVLVAGYCLITGRTMQPLLETLLKPRFAIVFASIVLLAWVYKIVLVLGS